MNSSIRSKSTVNSGILCLAFFLLVLTACNISPVQDNKDDKIIDIGSRLELFVDSLLVDRLVNLEFQMNHPQLLPLSRAPLSGSYVTVIKDGQLYRAYYRSIDPSYTGRSDYSGHPGEITCYAESTDGIDWIFPDLGLFEVNGTRKNNVVLAGQPPFSHNFSPFLDTRKDVDPNERFKALAGHPGYQRKIKAEGLHAFVSADGIRWRKLTGQAVIPYDMSWSHAFDSQNVSFWSETEQLYVCYFRTWTHKTRESKDPQKDSAGNSQIVVEAGKGLRSISRTTSSDFIHWSTPVAMYPNMPGEHLYTSQTQPYFRAPHIFIALPTRYMAGRVGTEKTDAMLGSTDILFMTSRAGSETYNRLFTDAFIRPGLDPERWQSRGNYVALNVIPTSDEEMSIYHGNSGHRYVLRTDGFISIHAGAEEGELITKLLTFTGEKLIINYSTSAAGSIQVEIIDTKGIPVPGFTLADCPLIVGDKIEGSVIWNNDPTLNTLQGEPVRLRFVMKEADLYSLQFKGQVLQ